MDLDDFIITAFCIIDDTMNDILRHRRLRQRGPKPSLSDSEVLSALKTLHRTSFVRQAANLCSVKELVWKGVLTQTSFDPNFHIIDSIPLPACRFARAYRCRRFKGDAASDTTPWPGRHSTDSVCTCWRSARRGGGWTTGCRRYWSCRIWLGCGVCWRRSRWWRMGGCERGAVRISHLHSG